MTEQNSPPAEVVGTGALDLWLVSLGPVDDLDRHSAVLSPDELARAARTPDPRVRRRYVLGRSALRHLLGGRLAVAPAALSFSYGERGKPALTGGGASFNLSHSGDLGLIAICDRGPIGVDLERVLQPRRLDLLAQRVLTDDEREFLANQRAAGADARWFFRFWTAKEAVAKALGFGLALSPRRLAVLADGSDRAVVSVAPATAGPLPDGAAPHEVVWLAGIDDAVAAVAIEGAGRQCRRWRQFTP